MALTTFAPPRAPSPGTSNTPKVKLREADFGDGYSQPIRDGLNHIKRTLSLTWEMMTPTEADVIKNFLIARGGDQSFYWTPSDESTPVKWRCKTWGDKKEKSGFVTVTAEFEQSFTLEI
jgi:phage-related protein